MDATNNQTTEICEKCGRTASSLLLERSTCCDAEIVDAPIPVTFEDQKAMNLSTKQMLNLAASNVALAAIAKITRQLQEVAEYLKDDEMLAALGTLDGFEEHVKNVQAAQQLLKMAARQ